MFLINGTIVLLGNTLRGAVGFVGRLAKLLSECTSFFSELERLSGYFIDAEFDRAFNPCLSLATVSHPTIYFLFRALLSAEFS